MFRSLEWVGHIPQIVFACNLLTVSSASNDRIVLDKRIEKRDKEWKRSHRKQLNYKVRTHPLTVTAYTLRAGKVAYCYDDTEQGYEEPMPIDIDVDGLLAAMSADVTPSVVKDAVKFSDAYLGNAGIGYAREDRGTVWT